MNWNTRNIPAAILAALVLCLPTLAQALPTVNFAQATDSTTERYGNHYLPVVISEAPTGQLTVSITLSSDTAEPGWDFVGGSTLVTFYPDGPDTAYASVQLYDDYDAEEDEYITLSIQGNPSYYETGEPSSMVLTLVDDDVAGPAARFVMDEDIPLSLHGDINLATEPDTDVDLTVEIAELPPGGATVLIAVDGIVSGLPFTNQTRQTITIPSPSVSSGENYAIRNVSIIGSQGQKVESEDVGLISVGVNMTSGNCIACFYAFVYQIALNGYCAGGVPSCGLGCGWKAEQGEPMAGTRSVEDDLTILRNYRDTVLLNTEVGEYYIQLHDDLVDDLFAAFLADPTMVLKARSVWETWVPVACALVDGQGEQMDITEAMMGDLLGLMDDLAEVGTPALTTALADLRSGMGLDDGPPANAGEFQVRVETSSTNTVREAWDGVKAMYR